LDEYILAGEVQETNKWVSLDRLRDIEKLEWTRDAVLCSEVGLK
jgi:hypothetical protein